MVCTMITKDHLSTEKIKMKQYYAEFRTFQIIFFRKNKIQLWNLVNVLCLSMDTGFKTVRIFLCGRSILSDLSHDTKMIRFRKTSKEIGFRIQNSNGC